MIELWGGGSPNVQKVLIALEETGLPYTLHFVDVLANEQFAPAFVALNPNGKVPVIVDAGGPGGHAITVWESGAILLYLAEKTGKFFASDAVSRYSVLQWLMLQMSGIGPMFGQNFHFTFYAKDEAHAYSRSRYGTEVRRLYDVVERRLADSRFLAGSEYTIADIAAWPWLRSHQLMGVDGAGMPNVSRWLGEIQERPAVKLAMQRVQEMPRRDFNQYAKEEPDKVDRYLGRGRYFRV